MQANVVCLATTSPLTKLNTSKDREHVPLLMDGFFFFMRIFFVCGKDMSRPQYLYLFGYYVEVFYHSIKEFKNYKGHFSIFVSNMMKLIRS